MVLSPPPAVSLRERTRIAMREEVTAVAIRLFVARGFDEVTTAEIAREAGISPRSFFRYFPTKEDVVLGSLLTAGLLVRDALAARPQQETAWQALRQALRVLIDHPVYPTDDLEAIAQIILDTPSIRARDLQKYQQWEELLAPDIAGRLAESDESALATADDRARALIGSALACLRIATERWLRSGGSDDPIAILDELLTAVRSG